MRGLLRAWALHAASRSIFLLGWAGSCGWLNTRPTYTLFLQSHLFSCQLLATLFLFFRRSARAGADNACEYSRCIRMLLCESRGFKACRHPVLA
ncbi:uncharacterized protein BKA78DRAFT_316791 [Phyllosticta capitalensis]|uniref:uncharacterized protein n=1 Tax=Phyllosticta capitalensis TaxID=121624 RepID=UPI0031317CF3